MSNDHSTYIESNGPSLVKDHPLSASSLTIDIEAEVSRLVGVLKVEPLDRSIEQFGDFIIYPAQNRDGIWRHGISGAFLFFGSFKRIDHTFSITTNDPALIARLIDAICENRELPGYRWQTPPYVEALLRIDRIALPSPHGKVKLVYDGTLLGEFEDNLKLRGEGDDSRWIGHEDGYWHHVAKRHLAQRHYDKVVAPGRQAVPERSRRELNAIASRIVTRYSDA